jgi:hypothetical protein
MTTQVDYTPEEWSLLLTTPYAAARAVMAASPSRVRGILLETEALSQAWSEAVQDAADDDLIRLLFLSLADGATPWSDVDGPPHLAVRDGIARCRRAIAVLAARASPEETGRYRKFILAAAFAVAGAAREGRLGLFGEHISPEEQAVLEQITDALNPSAA